MRFRDNPDYIPANPDIGAEPVVRDVQIRRNTFERAPLEYSKGWLAPQTFVINIHKLPFDAEKITRLVPKSAKKLIVLISQPVYAEETLYCDQFGLIRSVALEAELKTGQIALVKNL